MEILLFVLFVFLGHFNSVNKIGKINFPMETASDASLEFLDLKLQIVEGKIRVDVYAKYTNSFSNTTPCICYSKNNISNVPKGMGLRLRKTFDDDATFDKR